MPLLFVPFSLDEDGIELFSMATVWRANEEEAGKSKKIPKIVMFPDADEEPTDSEDLCYKFMEKDIKDNDVIYVLAHGFGSEDAITSTAEDAEYFLTAEKIVERMMELGFTPEMAGRLKALKLYICESEKDVNQKFAMNFARALGDDYTNLGVCYYEKCVSAPLDLKDGKGCHKLAKDSVDAKQTYRASEVRKEIKVSDALSMFAKKRKTEETKEEVSEEVKEIEADVLSTTIRRVHSSE